MEGTEDRLGIQLDVNGNRCDACGEVVISDEEMQRQEAALAEGLVARGIRAGNEFKLVRKDAGLKANELAVLLGISPETVWRWENDKAEIPRAFALALGELWRRPRVALTA